MKFIPDSIGRKIGEQGLLASENAPKILFVGGVVGMVGSTVLACRATLKLSDTLKNAQHDLNVAREITDEDYEQAGESRKKDITIIYSKNVFEVARLYAPAVLLGGASVVALTKSHNILQNRNLALTAAYAAVDTAFSRYRERVIDRYGEDADRDLRYESESVDIVDEETGKVLSTTRVIDGPGSPYRRFYDEESSRNWSPDPEINMLFLRNMQNVLNDKLKACGHVFLNEVFSELGMTHTKAGAVVGWRWNKGSGDDEIDFGIWDGKNEAVNDFFNGREGAILLDFNVDGVIYHQIEETGR